MHLAKASAHATLDRRTLLVTLALLGLTGAASPESADALLRRAVARAGGRRALAAARVLRWTGAATIFAGARRIEIGVDTEVEPRVRARSRSWLLSDGPDKSRTMILEPGAGWIERNGQRQPMPEAMRRHEEQQFATYGAMRLTDLVVLRREGQDLLVKTGEPGAQESWLRFDPSARLIGLDNEVDSPEGGARIRQRFAFEGRMPGPIAWPRRIRIEQDGAPYFDLRLATFSAGPT